MKILKVSLLLVAVGFLQGCAPMQLGYTPASTMTVKGGMIVTDVVYTPAETGRVKPNQIKNTAVAPLMFTGNISEYFKNALLVESRFVGININDTSKKLSGKINQFLIDDLGFNVDWLLSVDYTVKTDTGEECYNESIVTKKHLSKFIGNFPAILNNSVRDNIERLFNDEKFRNCIDT